MGKYRRSGNSRTHRSGKLSINGKSVIAFLPIKPMPTKRHIMRALSIRQPYAEQILRGIKKVEYRSRPTNIRGRIYIYTSIKPADYSEFRKMKAETADFPTGMLVGTVELVGCTLNRSYYRWHLAKPKRLSKPLKPRNHPQPVWFYPFRKD